MIKQGDILNHQTPDGIKYLLFNNDIISNEIIATGFFEKYVIDAASDILSTITDGIILDIGANIGSFSLPLAKQYPNLKFYCFEPLIKVYENLQSNILINNFNNIQSFNFALGNENILNFCKIMPYDCGNIGANSLKFYLNEFRSGSLNYITELIEFKTIDSMNFSNIKFIKIDVEGFEYEVISGAIETIKQCNYPPIMFECWTLNWYKDERDKILSFLKKIGYNFNYTLLENVISFKNEDEFNKYKILLR